MFGSLYHPRSQVLIEGSHKPTLEVVQSFVNKSPDDWATQLPLARWAWNTTNKESLYGVCPNTVVTGLIPRSPWTSYLKLPNKERVTGECFFLV